MQFSIVTLRAKVSTSQLLLGFSGLSTRMPAPASPSDVMSRKVRFSVRSPGAMVIKIARVFAFDFHAFSDF